MEKVEAKANWQCFFAGALWILEEASPVIPVHSGMVYACIYT